MIRKESEETRIVFSLRVEFNRIIIENLKLPARNGENFFANTRIFLMGGNLNRHALFTAERFHCQPKSNFETKNQNSVESTNNKKLPFQTPQPQ